ncbi:MAG TPA: hypothetical protein VEV39_00020 [Gemmatimonadales bacterium]|nr:hypothetical protein [Gemmatimonadales bacterium]
MIQFDPPSHATAVSALPERYKELESLLVPAEELGTSYYSYALHVGIDQLRTDFEAVHEN